MQLNKEKQLVIKAINGLGRRVSAADISTQTGLALNSATLTLNQVAAEAGGHLQVSSSGDIAYQFPIDYQSRYIAKGIQQIIEKLSRRIFEIAFFLLRISFGVMLVLSLITIVLIFVVIIFAASKSRDDNDEFSFNLDFFDWMILRELIFWNMNSPVLTYGGYDSPATRKPPKGNFLYNCFSFLFGDGDPNANLDERRWQIIAELIRKNNGAVTAEQLAPYTEDNLVNEDNMLPILVRFDGKPMVSESGNIIYIFPSLQVTAIDQRKTETRSYLKIFPWQFSQVGIDSLFWVIMLGAANFLGSWWLYIHFAHSLVFSSLTPLLLVLVVYGTLFVVVPLLRYLAIQVINARIERGNQVRKNHATQLENPDSNLNHKLKEAHQMSLTERQIKNDNLIYDTQKDLLEQEFPSINNA